MNAAANFSLRDRARGRSSTARRWRRFGRREELVGAVHWLCNDASSFVTGTVIAVDGGFSAFSGV